MKTDGFSLYKQYLCGKRRLESEQDKQDVIDDLVDSLYNNPAYQVDAKRNFVPQPLVVNRKNTYTCEFTVIPGDEMYIGDLVEVLGEHWIVTEKTVDEYGIIRGSCWMSNICFRFQNGTPKIICRYAVLDDGSYTDTTGKPVSTADANYTCYMCKDEKTSQLYVDKRLAIDKVVTANGDEVLIAGRISWIDGKSGNYGEGSHLLKFRLDYDLYNPQKDSIEEMVCDYIPPEDTDDTTQDDTETGGGEDTETPDAPDDDTPAEPPALTIDGNDTLRIGATRTYEAVFEDNGTDVPNFTWSTDLAGITLNPTTNGLSCKVKVPLDGTYIGKEFEIVCEDTNAVYGKCSKKVVITNG